MADQRRQRGVWARLNLRTMSATMTTSQWQRQWHQLNNGDGKKEARFRDLREREEHESETKVWTERVFPFKFLTGRVSFYGLVNMETEPNQKLEILTLRDPYPTRLSILIYLWAFGSDQVGRVVRVWQVDGQPYSCDSCMTYLTTSQHLYINACSCSCVCS